MTREELEMEIAEKREDLEVFARALSEVRARVQYSQDMSRSRIPLHGWAGATGLVDMMTVIVHNMERVVSELEASIEKAPRSTTFRVIEGGADDEAG